MVSLPVIPENSNKDSVFQSNSSMAFYYDNGYSMGSSLQLGVGYWLKFPVPNTIKILGDDVPQDTVNVVGGWNLIGTPSYEISAASVTSDPPGILSSQFYGYLRGYFIASALMPMQGYWIKVNGPGKLLLGQPDSATMAKPFLAEDAVKSFNTLTVSDQSDGEQTLYFGTNDKIDLSKFEAPPAPPRGVLNVRYATGHLLEVADSKLQKNVPIAFSSASYPLTISWDASRQSGTYSLHIDGKETVLRGQGRLTIAGSAHQVSLGLSPVAASNLPKEFALYQNYPNPFNPSTTIRFDLPQDAVVTLKVYNILGQEVLSIAENKSYQAGSYGEQGVR